MKSTAYNGNRAEDDASCTRCGGVIVELDPRLKMCSQCQLEVNDDARERIKYRKERQGKARRIRVKVPFLAGLHNPKKKK